MKRIGASGADMQKLEDEIVARPHKGDVIPGLVGVRKLRFGFGGRGKRGGARAIYFLMTESMVAMLAAYAKSAQSDLTQDERKAIAAQIKEITNG